MEHLSTQELPVSHPTAPAPDRPGPLAGIRVVELTGEFCAFAGRLLADAGADVIVVEPPEGSPQRAHAPFAEDNPGLETSLSWWAENTSKRGVVADLETADGQAFFRRLVASADVLLEAETPGRLTGFQLDYPQLATLHPELIHVAITPTGRSTTGVPGPGWKGDVTDLTLLARGGPMWSCGYDDHDLPPVRGRGNQGLRMAGHFAVMSAMTALLGRRALHDEGKPGGQFVDVSMVAAANVTTEFGSYGWMAAQETVQRQTGRHATPRPTDSTQVRCADGRYLNTGVPPRRPREFGALLEWIRELGLEDDYPLSALLEMGSGYEFISLQMIQEDPLAGEVFGSGRDAMHFIATHVSAHEAFVGFQQRGIACGVVWSPDEVMADPHFVERGFSTEVHHDQIDRSVTYPGPPIRFTASPMGVRSPAPTLGQHTDELLAELEQHA